MSCAGWARVNQQWFSGPVRRFAISRLVRVFIAAGRDGSELALAKHHDVLHGQKLGGAFPIQWQPAHFQADLRFAHFMQRLDRYLGIFGAVLDEYHAAARLERTHDGAHDFERETRVRDRRLPSPRGPANRWVA